MNKRTYWRCMCVDVSWTSNSPSCNRKKKFATCFLALSYKICFALKKISPKTRREEKQLETQCTLLCLVFPPGALPGDHTHRSWFGSVASDAQNPRHVVCALQLCDKKSINFNFFRPHSTNIDVLFRSGWFLGTIKRIFQSHSRTEPNSTVWSQIPPSSVLWREK